MSTVTLRLDSERDRALARAARRLGRSKSEVLREAFDWWRSRENSGAEGEKSPYELMKDLIGISHSGRTDLSVNTGRKYTEMLWEEKRARDADRRRPARRAG